MKPSGVRPSARGLVLAIGFIIGGCDDENITVVTVPTENRPPRIIAQGPDFPAGGVDVEFVHGGPDLYVLVADPDGLDDISAVFLNVGSVTVHRVIARPDSGDSCAEPSYAANDTFNIGTLIPSTFPGLVNFPMGLQAGGIYTTPNFCLLSFDCPAAPRIDRANASFGRSVRGCATGSFILWFGVYPPAVPSPSDIFITYLDVEYTGITATVYDAAGLSAATSFPNLRLIHATEEERRVAP